MIKIKEDEKWEVDETEEPEISEKDIIIYQILSYPADYTLKGYFDKWESNQLLIPDFQRNYVWDQTRASKLLESFLLGLPVPGVFLYKEKSKNNLLVIDGQQRIMTAIMYFKNDFLGRPFRLKNVSEKWNNKAFNELSERDQNQLNDAVLRATIVQQLDPNDESSIYYIFERLNTGGMNLSPMEVRKSLYHGKYYDILEELNKDKRWRHIIGKEKPDKRLRDIEFILRIFALYYKWKEYEKPMKNFLTEHITDINNKGQPDEKKLLEIKEIFVNLCKFIFSNLGGKPFHLRNRLNYAVMDSVMVISIAAMKKRVSNIKEKFKSLLRDRNYIKNVTINTSDDKTLKARFKIAEKHLL